MNRLKVASWGNPIQLSQANHSLLNLGDMMPKIVIGGLAALLVASPAFAQSADTGSLPAVAPAIAMRTLSLPPNTEVVLTPNDTLSTKNKQIKVGEKFALATMFDVMQNGFVVIPKGTPGEGTITYRTGTGAFGKSGKMEVSFDYLTLGGQRIPLTGSYRQEGEGNTGAAVGAVVAVGVFGAFVKGHSASIPNGQQLRAHTVEPLTFTVPADAPQVVQGTVVAAQTAAPAAVTVVK